SFRKTDENFFSFLYSLVVQFSKINFVFVRYRCFSGNFYNISPTAMDCKSFFEIARFQFFQPRLPHAAGE
ncbi:hypothetical protein, partial [Paenibacillus macerans]|uniref:hypothetical protein n=1 Tax=Paenibacillus macerans TaxID=44252 RepID=UPI003D3205E6